jgi:hypothetical protein
MHSKKIVLGVVAFALIALMVSSASACYCRKPGKSPGYWKHNVSVYVNGVGSYSGTPHETDAKMEYYEARIQTRFAWFTLEWANSIFQDNQYQDQWLWLANLFNWAAGRAPYYG